jgi:hypothetical protein
VKQVTPRRFSCRHGVRERIADFAIIDEAVFGQGQAMGQRLQALRSKDWRPGNWRSRQWRSGAGERLWLSMLVDTLEEMSRPEFRSLPCDPSVLIAVGAQLARPASPCLYGASDFSLRN